MTGSARGRVPRTHPADVLVAEAAAVGCVRLDGSLSLHLRSLLASKRFVLSSSRRSAMVHFFASFTLSPPRPDEGREGQRYRGKKQKRKPHKEREGQRHRGKKQKGKNSTRARKRKENEIKTKRDREKKKKSKRIEKTKKTKKEA